MAEHLPKHSPGKTITYTVGATAVIGGQLVTLSADDTIIPTTGSAVVVGGVAGHDALTGALTTVQNGGVHELTASVAITAGQRIQAAAAGQVAVWAGVNAQEIIGFCVRGSAAGASTGRYRLCG